MCSADGGDNSKIVFQLVDAFFAKKIEDGASFTGCDDGEDYSITDETYIKIMSAAQENFGERLEDEESSDFCEIKVDSGKTYELLVKAWESVEKPLIDTPSEIIMGFKLIN